MKINRKYVRILLAVLLLIKVSSALVTNTNSKMNLRILAFSCCKILHFPPHMTQMSFADERNSSRFETETKYSLQFYF